MDNYYLKQLGRRKTYVVISQYILGILIFFVAFRINDLLHNIDVPNLFWICLVLNFVITVQSVAVDGWAVNIAKKSEYSMMTAVKLISDKIGIIVSNNLLVWFNNK
jgi:PAT family acetyl-CoA transporter-like MFS transporter 1